MRADSCSKLRVAFGPWLPGWGSWDWLGADTAGELSRWFDTALFQWGDVPDCDLTVIIKHLPSFEIVQSLARRSSIIYCPVDYYGHCDDISRDASALRLCSRIVVHCHRLRRFFQRYASVDYFDHHLKFVSERTLPYRRDGYVLWTGVRTNLPPLIEWLNRAHFDEPLLILSNFEDANRPPRAAEIGLRHTRRVSLEPWSAERHLAALAGAKAAIDIKGGDFRQRHKPPAKALDFLASGLPLAMNASSSVEHLAQMGFDVASPRDAQRWFSREYWQETAAFGAALRDLLCLPRVALRWKQLIEQVAARSSAHEELAYELSA